LRKRASAKPRADEALREHSFGLKPPGIILIGFMGAGKSSVGRSLAEHVGWTFEDLDQRIETRTGRKVHEIFRDLGEAKFRKAERAALQEVIGEMRGGGPKILALGGGTFVQDENAKLIAESGLSTVFLDADVEELWRRCRAQTRGQVERPLLSDLSGFRELYKIRRPHYARARFHQLTDGQTIDETVEELAKLLALSFKGEGPKQRNPGRRKRGEKN
jgi:shikimate kinase